MTKGGPIEVTSRDGMEWRQEEQVIIAKGDAKAVRGTVTVTADQLVAHYRKKAARPELPAPRRRPRTTRPAPHHRRIPATTRSTVWSGGQRPHLHRDRPGLRRQGDLRHGPGRAGLTGHDLHIITPQQTMSARDEMEYWSQKHMAVGPRQRRGQHQRRPAPDCRHPGRLHRRPERNRPRRGPVQKVAAAAKARLSSGRRSAGQCRRQAATGGCVRHMSRSAPPPRSSMPTRASTSPTPASRGWPATCTSPAGRTSSTATRR